MHQSFEKNTQQDITFELIKLYNITINTIIEDTNRFLQTIKPRYAYFLKFKIGRKYKQNIINQTISKNNNKIIPEVQNMSFKEIQNLSYDKHNLENLYVFYNLIIKLSFEISIKEEILQEGGIFRSKKKIFKNAIYKCQEPFEDKYLKQYIDHIETAISVTDIIHFITTFNCNYKLKATDISKYEYADITYLVVNRESVRTKINSLYIYLYAVHKCFNLILKKTTAFPIQQFQYYHNYYNKYIVEYNAIYNRIMQQNKDNKEYIKELYNFVKISYKINGGEYEKAYIYTNFHDRLSEDVPQEIMTNYQKNQNIIKQIEGKNVEECCRILYENVFEINKKFKGGTRKRSKKSKC